MPERRDVLRRAPHVWPAKAMDERPREAAGDNDLVGPEAANRSVASNSIACGNDLLDAWRTFSIVRRGMHNSSATPLPKEHTFGS